MLYGSEPGWSPLHEPPTEPAREALERACLQGLLRPPCAVSFSGGRDSSAVLAVATHVARRHGLPDPIPVSLRFRRTETADEAAWQEMTVRHLGLQDWERHYFDDQMDVLGPFAQRVIRQHGLLWPLNAHFHLPVIDSVAGGSVLTGVGGDEVLLPSDWVRVNRLRAGSIGVRPLDPIRLLIASGPLTLRSRWYRRRLHALDMPWLTEQAQRTLLRDIARQWASQPVPWDRWLREAWWPDRGRIVGAASLTALAAAGDVRLVQPLEDAGFLSALAHDKGAEGFHGRTQAMRELVGDLLPREVTGRRSKGWFDTAFLTPATREIAASWDGSGVDEDVVDVRALTAMWRSDDIDPRSLLLLQHLWRERTLTPAASEARPAVVCRGPRPRGRVPDFFVVGVAKAGTSALHSVLQQHPDVWMGRVKEPHYFAWLADPGLVGDVFEDPSGAWDEYLGLFEGAREGDLVGDASNSSFAVPGAAAAIHRASPDARIVVLLRDPAERALSHFVHFAAAGAETTRDVAVAVLRTNEERARQSLPFTYDYLGWSRYGERLAEYFDVFGRERVHIELHEDLVRDPAAVVSRIVAFLGATPFSPVLGRRVNELRMARWPAVTDVVFGRSLAGRRVERLLPRSAVDAARRRLQPHLFIRPTLSEDVRARIIGAVTEDVRQLEHLLGRDLSHWRTP